MEGQSRAQTLLLFFAILCLAFVGFTVAHASQTDPFQKSKAPAVQSDEPLKDDFLVVIDPGHGGADYGAKYIDPSDPTGKTAVTEKDMTLRLSIQLARALKKRGIKSTLTRRTDQELPLTERTALANRLKADVFLSIHLNSEQRPVLAKANGIETYILNFSTNQTSQRLATLENNVLRDSVAKELQPDAGSDVALIVKDLILNSNREGSQNLGCLVQGELTQAFQRASNRGVKQGLFYVLLGADMPALLIEAGFLSHAEDRKRVVSPEGRMEIADAISKAIAKFRDTQTRATKGPVPADCKLL